MVLIEFSQKLIPKFFISVVGESQNEFLNSILISTHVDQSESSHGTTKPIPLKRFFVQRGILLITTEFWCHIDIDTFCIIFTSFFYYQYFLIVSQQRC